MHLDVAVKSGCRIRHRDWPPYHYAELRPMQCGSMRLHRVKPDGTSQPFEIKADRLNDRQNWKILDIRPE